METATAAAPAPAEVLEELVKVGEQTNGEIWKWQTWVHVGPGAENCDDVSEGDEATGVEPSNACTNPRHFHAWIRLPNQFQHADCKKAGSAAKARLKRMLRDPESDAHWGMEGDLQDIEAAGENGRAAALEELVHRDWWADFLDAAEDIKDWIDDTVEVGEDEDPERPYANIEADQERFREILGMPESEQPEDEREHLQRHIAEFTDRHEARVKELQQPRREAFDVQSTAELIDHLRRDRIEAAGSAEFNEAYAAEQWFLCTARYTKGPRYFKDREELRNAAPEVLSALDEAYKDLTRAAGTSGN